MVGSFDQILNYKIIFQKYLLARIKETVHTALDILVI